MRKLGIEQDGGVEAAEDAVEDHGPDIAQHDAADEVGHEEYGAEQIAALDALGEEIGHGEGQHVNQHQGHHGKHGGVPEGVAEAHVAKRLDIVIQADKFCVGDGLEPAQGQPDALEEGPDEADDKGRRHRPQEE